jgi:hypothetical protein
MTARPKWNEEYLVHRSAGTGGRTLARDGSGSCPEAAMGMPGSSGTGSLAPSGADLFGSGEFLFFFLTFWDRFGRSGPGIPLTADASAGGAAPGALGPTGVPQDSQKLVSGASGIPHFAQAGGGSWRSPQDSQKTVPSGTSFLQLGQHATSFFFLLKIPIALSPAAGMIRVDEHGEFRLIRIRRTRRFPD